MNDLDIETQELFNLTVRQVSRVYSLAPSRIWIGNLADSFASPFGKYQLPFLDHEFLTVVTIKTRYYCHLSSPSSPDSPSFLLILPEQLDSRLSLSKSLSLHTLRNFHPAHFDKAQSETMSAEVDTLPPDGDVDDNLTPEDLNGGGSEDDADLFGDDDDEEIQAGSNECVPCKVPPSDV